MLYLIGGVAKGGKTYIARKIMEDNNIPYFSTDFLLWSLSDKGIVNLNHNDPDSIASKILEPFISSIIDYLIWNEDEYVLEGTHITTEFVRNMQEKYPNKIRACFLGYQEAESENKFNEIMKYEKTLNNKWYRVLKEAEFIEFLKKKIEESKDLKEKCIKLDYTYFEVKDISKQSKEIIRYLLNK